MACSAGPDPSTPSPTARPITSTVELTTPAPAATSAPAPTLVVPSATATSRATPAAATAEPTAPVVPTASSTPATSTARRARGAFGIPGAGVEGVIGVDGTLAARSDAPAVHFQLTDRETGLAVQPSDTTVTQSLRDNQIPLITTVWTLPRWVVTWTVFAESTGPDPIVRQPRDGVIGMVRVQIHPLPGATPATFSALVGPENPAGPVAVADVAAAVGEITSNKNAVLVAGRPANRASTVPVAPKPPLTPGATPTSVPGAVDGSLEYDLDPANATDTILSFAVPMTDSPSIDAMRSAVAACLSASCEDPVATGWQQTLHRLDLTVPDQRIDNAFYASLAYLLMAQSNAGFFSGPASERATWVRDSAFGTQALALAGHADAAKAILGVLQSGQQANGRLAPIINPDGTPRLPLKSEWDAQGEYIYSIVEYARVTGDEAFLREEYPSLRRAAEYQQQLLDQTRTAALQSTPYYGLLPAGESAEDLYSATWHHYWDDFWGIIGFHEIADAATQLGVSSDATLYQTEETTFRSDVLKSLAPVKTSDGLPYVPNAPEDTQSSAMARSATTAVWPFPALDPQSFLVQHSFEAYYQWVIAPYGGAYRHYGNNDWPYAGLSLAHAFYNLGLYDHTWEVLNWTLDHQTVPNLYAWGEAVDPVTFDLVSGDVPHTWMAAEMVLLVRDILVRESGQQLAIGPFPDSWLPPGGKIALAHAPTTLGDTSYTLTRSSDGHSVTIAIDGAPRANGFVLQLPTSLQPATLVVNGGPPQPISGPQITLSKGTRTATITLQSGG